ncbi:MAG: response regulator transcription factor [Planctomycetes bacterium]|nr:response regulator transcription factor [Planctomycetota bacterium]
MRVNEEKWQHESEENKAQILIIDGHPMVRQQLVQFINQQSTIGSCTQANNINQALDAVSEQQIDLAIVDISLGKEASTRITEEIKLQYPNLPVLVLSIDDELLYAKHAFQGRTKKCVIGQQTKEQIITAINYIQSLLSNRVFGFTVFVNIETCAV